ncbi:hypothetical protein BDV26DRAFT_289739 [Aspergillus bertholletiae]|uniref:Uncharacterized protein n=1 Tax=Aspergillus bertholletiae TaxID=1226010 RepID=A0A5N7BHI0_9EURO|nr:hypothetical protein BDV26DRAFT_289739 [Aspergillus bertholletiae]
MPDCTQGEPIPEQHQGIFGPYWQYETIGFPEPIYRLPSQSSPDLQGVDLERRDGPEIPTTEKAEKSPKKKRYIFGVPDNPLEDSASETAWMREMDEEKLKPETDTSQHESEQGPDTWSQKISRLTHRISLPAYIWFSPSVYLLIVVGIRILLPYLLVRKKQLRKKRG